LLRQRLRRDGDPERPTGADSPGASPSAKSVRARGGGAGGGRVQGWGKPRQGPGAGPRTATEKAQSAGSVPVSSPAAVWVDPLQQPEPEPAPADDDLVSLAQNLIDSFDDDWDLPVPLPGSASPVSCRLRPVGAACCPVLARWPPAPDRSTINCRAVQTISVPRSHNGFARCAGSTRQESWLASVAGATSETRPVPDPPLAAAASASSDKPEEEWVTQARGLWNRSSSSGGGGGSGGGSGEGGEATAAGSAPASTAASAGPSAAWVSIMLLLFATSVGTYRSYRHTDHTVASA